MAKNRLTPKQRRFCEEYLIDLNATQAAIRAGYSEKTAEVIGFENLRKPNIAEYIKKHMDKRQERTEITADRILKELALIAFSDQQDIVEVEEGGTILMKRFEDMPEGVSRTISDICEDRIIRESADGSQAVVHDKVKYKRYDKVKALELLMKHLGMLSEKLNLPTDYVFRIIYANGNGTKPKPVQRPGQSGSTDN